MENEILMQILSELKEVKTDLQEVKTDLQEVKERVTVIEIDHSKMLTALFDGQSGIMDILNNEIRPEIRKINIKLDNQHMNHMVLDDKVRKINEVM